MYQKLRPILFTAILLLTFFTTGYSAESCRDLFGESVKPSIWATLNARLRMTETNHSFDANSLLQELSNQGLLIYKGDHEYVPGTEFLASNEFDWARTPTDHTETDAVIGFGTNTVWDIALRKKAKLMVIGDWSPWPVISQAFIVKPLIRIASTPQEFILMLSGMPKQMAQGLSVQDAFQVARGFDNSSFAMQKPMVQQMLAELAKNSKISDLELKFLTTYFRPRLGDNANPNGFGPFAELRSANFALLNSFYMRRYDPGFVGNVESVFSSSDNFSYLKSMFDNDKIIFGVTSITDKNFYQKIKSDRRLKGLKNLTLSITNIFDCGGYNGLTFSDLQNYLKSVSAIFKKPLTVFRTTSFKPPHGYYRYQIDGQKDIPTDDEADSTALHDESKKAG